MAFRKPGRPMPRKPRLGRRFEAHLFLNDMGSPGSLAIDLSAGRQGRGASQHGVFLRSRFLGLHGTAPSVRFGFLQITGSPSVPARGGSRSPR